MSPVLFICSFESQHNNAVNRLFLQAFNEYALIKCLKIKLQFLCHRTFLARFGSIRAMVRIFIHCETKREKQTSKLFVLLFLHVTSLMNDSESQHLHKNRLSQGLGHALCTRCDPVSAVSIQTAVKVTAQVA